MEKLNRTLFFFFFRVRRQLASDVGERYRRGKYIGSDESKRRPPRFPSEKGISLRASLTRGNGDRRVERGAGKTARIPRFEEQRRSFFQIPMETKGAVAPLSRRFSSRYLVVEARQWSSNF